jgi:hypothetical protein
MNHRASSQIALFDLHDSPVREISVVDGDVRLGLEFASIGKEHPCNPHGKAQAIGPCSIVFRGVDAQVVKVFSEKERVFTPHPDPTMPIDGEIMEFVVEELTGRTAIVLAGFHKHGWVEWRFMCSSVEVSWSDFLGDAWYES